MIDDIVARLRCTGGLDARLLCAAADEIERMRKECFHLAANQCHAGYGGEYGHHRCADIDRLTKERDEARRQVCIAEAMLSPRDDQTARKYAEERGWDCFKEER